MSVASIQSDIAYTRSQIDACTEDIAHWEGRLSDLYDFKDFQSQESNRFLEDVSGRSARLNNADINPAQVKLFQQYKPKFQDLLLGRGYQRIVEQKEEEKRAVERAIEEVREKIKQLRSRLASLQSSLAGLEADLEREMAKDE